MASCSSSPWPPIPLLLLLLLFFFLLASPSPVLAAPAASSQQQAESGGNTTAAAWTPRLRKTFLDGGVERWRGRRLVGRFQVCAVCTCCGGPHGMCIPAPCCYAINCNIPNRPFGVCSFTPRTCNCLNCHL
ncbi:hypothetical protein GQ55_8G153300 [Panicum hallii var. hallii]|uniref:DUF7866 domain-containing protein n=1 Tax=Panicum hallii var. hallii TaxID=1504633 RepID=A0A2T7CNA9_9POAL|nr:hypothetical protein GQ55_8G153300 [Panicum hallii var. hallii]PUZ44804.1 hypothetical protein GQ55_8G153300 [Panicum hallii var. hallii]PUZ44805.1 hypothetical protein GQ55_8G153300 [Panicum hallii var. hallii]